jgi:hypothetical protein
MVNMPRPRRPAHAPRSLSALAARPLFVVLAAGSLLAGIAGGLLRAGVAWPLAADAALMGHAALSHAALMMSCFLGTVIAIERAVAIKLRAAFAAPIASGAAGALLLAGQHDAAAAAMVFAALVFVAVNMVVVMRQPASHTAVLLAGAFAWLLGNLMFAAGLGAGAAVPWWFGMLVLTIAGERLEMTRLMRRHPASQPALALILLALLAGAALSAALPVAGGVLFGGALAALAAWLGLFDIARRTALTHGLSRYMALCLLSGYVWLAIAGVAWAAMALGWPTRDLALHALGLGFIFSMVMGHAPVILPAVARIKLRFGAHFYVPLLMLHASLALRLGLGFADPEWRAVGAVMNAIAIAFFAATVAASAIAWTTHGGQPAPTKTP